jgi:hypothetical protein
MGALRRIPARLIMRQGQFVAFVGLATRQNLSLQNGGFLAFGGIFYGRIKSKGLVHPALSLFAVDHQE